MGGNPGLVLLGDSHVPKVVGSNPCTVKLDGHFSRMFVVKIVMFVWKDENKQKRPGIAHLKTLYLSIGQ